MWFQFESLSYEEGRTGKTGTKYNAWVMRGLKKGFGGDPDTPYEKVLFDNVASTIIEHGIARPNQSVLQFFQKAVAPGDIVKIKYVRNGTRWDFDTLEPLTKTVPTYEPLTPEQITQLQVSAAVSPSTSSTSSVTPPWVK